MASSLRPLLVVGCVSIVGGCATDDKGGSGFSTSYGSDPTTVDTSNNATSGNDSADQTDGDPSDSMEGDSGNPTGADSGTPTGADSSDPTGMDTSNPTGADSTDPSVGTDASPKFDLPPTPQDSGPSDDTGGGKGCEKIDFLFVVDNSSSMNVHQQNLRNSFGPFIDTIISTVQGSDYHIMVIDSDECVINNIGTIPPPPPPYQCQNGCDAVLGAGHIRDCAVPDGKRYLTSALDAATLKSTFQCIANVGITGSADEMPMSALVEAVGPLNGPGQCNEGFLRNDAVLVITVISDDHSGWSGNDNENGFGGTPQSWFDGVMAAKKGVLENVVVLGLYAQLSDPFTCIAYAPREADQFIAFTKMFGSQGIIGTVCAPDYNNPFFQNAVALIDTTCEGFVPPPE